MNPIRSCYFLSQQYERDHVNFITVENGSKHASISAIYAKHLSYKVDNQLQVRCSTLLFTTVLNALHFFRN